ncbi:MAG: twin-arginine translocase TatA/TatE family subunit [Infirmifilum sp.]
MYLSNPNVAPIYSIGLGPTEILLLAIIAIILFAPRKIPELAKAIKESADILRKETSEDEVRKDEPEKEKQLEKISEKLKDKEEKNKKRLF